MKLQNTTEAPMNQGEAREAAILQNIDLVNHAARRFHLRVPPCVALDDLISAGTIGLIQAVDRFDHARGPRFRTYAQHRIQGAMLDFLRQEDPLSRAERRRVRESADGPEATTVSLNETHLRRPSAPTEAAFTNHHDIRRARRSLSARENRVIALLYDFGWQSREVAVELSVNESRVSQIKQRAIAKLRLLLEPGSVRSSASAPTNCDSDRNRDLIRGVNPDPLRSKDDSPSEAIRFHLMPGAMPRCSLRLPRKLRGVPRTGISAPNAVCRSSFPAGLESFCQNANSRRHRTWRNPLTGVRGA
jgi:RNA polymerase sigma factor (sigma-70 family)